MPHLLGASTGTRGGAATWPAHRASVLTTARRASAAVVGAKMAVPPGERPMSCSTSPSTRASAGTRAFVGAAAGDIRNGRTGASW